MGRRKTATVKSADSKLEKIANLPEGVSKAVEAVKELNENNEKEEEKNSEPVSSELKDLVLFGKVIEDVKVGEYTIKMSTLTNKQQKKLVKRLLKFNNDERLMNVKEFTLAEAIISINGLPLEELYDDEEELSVEEMRAEVVSEMQSNLVEKLYDKYESLIEKSNKFFENGDLGDKVKN